MHQSRVTAKSRAWNDILSYRAFRSLAWFAYFKDNISRRDKQLDITAMPSLRLHAVKNQI